MDQQDSSAPRDRNLHLVGRVAIPTESEQQPRREESALLGQLVGNYRVVAKLGQGGMGTVYEAVHQQIGRRAAIKVLGPELSQNVENATRFLNEARAVNVVKHQGLVQIFEFGQLPDGTTYIVMEFLEGESLGARLERSGGRLSGPEALRLSRQIATSLAAAHQRGVIHRDLKPSNVMIVQDPEVPSAERTKILDFGIAKVIREKDNRESPGFQTGTGVVLGTPIYMAPEQCRAAGDIDERADVYSLGVILYQMLCGQPPFNAREPVELMAMHLCMSPRPLRDRDPTISEEIATLVQEMLRKGPSERPSMGQVAAELERLEGPTRNATSPSLQTLEQFFANREVRAETPTLRRSYQPIILLVTFVLGIITTAVIVWLWNGPRPPRPAQPSQSAQPTLLPRESKEPVVVQPAAPPKVPALPEQPATSKKEPQAPVKPAPSRVLPSAKSVHKETKPTVTRDEDIELFK